LGRRSEDIHFVALREHGSRMLAPDPIERFVEGQNIAHYLECLKIENDPIKREVLQKLLAEARAKLTTLGLGTTDQESCRI
jgi:hypothetical protein